MATHSNIPRTEEPGLQATGYSPQGRKESDITEATYHAHTQPELYFVFI